MTYSHFAAIARMAFVESAAKDFAGRGMKSPASSVCALTGMTPGEVEHVMAEHEKFEASGFVDSANPLHGSFTDGTTIERTSALMVFP